MKITLNCDLGEGLETDKEVMPFLGLANIACGGHAGDEATMRATLQLAKKFSVQPGAHPGYPDKKNFGREVLPMAESDVSRFVTAQTDQLAEIATAENYPLTFVKPHGALNNKMCVDDSLLAAICEGIKQSTCGRLPLVMPVTARRERMAEVVAGFGLEIWWEVFADRQYNPDGSLRSRKLPGAVHADSASIIGQCQALIGRGEAFSDGEAVKLAPFDTICIHGDNAPSVTLASEIKKLLDGR